MTVSSISLLDSAPTAPSRILQLYQYLELYSAGDPPRNTLFVLERAPLSVIGASSDRLLLIDPPSATLHTFRLECAVTSIFTGEPCDSGLPQMQTQPGGVAHLRIGDHFLDIYSQRTGNVIYFPALAILCGGNFGSDAAPPVIARGSDGSEELDTLRLLAQLVKRKVQLYIPQVGELITDGATVLQRLAEDVHYLHNLRRVVPSLAQRGEAIEDVWQLADDLLPAGRRSEYGRRLHQNNLQILWTVPH